MTVVSMGRVTAAPDQLAVQAKSCQEGLVEPGGQSALMGLEALSSPLCSLVHKATWESHHLKGFKILWTLGEKGETGVG